MAMTFHSIEGLGAPFANVAELGFVIPTGGVVSLENHEFKLVFFLQATCSGHVDGHGSFAVSTGDVLVVPYRCTQTYRADERGQSPNLHALKVVFSIPPISPAGEATPGKRSRANPESNLSAFVCHHLRDIRHLPTAQTAPVQEILSAIRREAEDHRPGIRHRVRALCTNLVVHVARMVHDVPSATQPGAKPRGPCVVHIKEFLLRNYARELTLAEIAWHVRKSEEHVARLFRRVTGQTIFEYLRTIRLERAKTLLIQSDKTLTEIARNTGFSSLALFSRNFSHHVGRTPSTYRNAHARLVNWLPA